MVEWNGATTQDYSKFSPFTPKEGEWLFSAPDPDDILIGQSSMRRREVANATASLASQSLRLTYFTATKTETLSQVAITTGTVAAAATPTLCRVGVYREESNGDLTLVAACANDTTLFAAASTAYTRSLIAPVDIVKGMRYAIGILVVTAVATPSFYGNSGLIGLLSSVAPRISALATPHADLPSTLLTGAINSSSVNIYSVLLP